MEQHSKELSPSRKSQVKLGKRHVGDSFPEGPSSDLESFATGVDISGESRYILRRPLVQTSQIFFFYIPPQGVPGLFFRLINDRRVTEIRSFPVVGSAESWTEPFFN